jgi:WD40 repeat protein
LYLGNGEEALPGGAIARLGSAHFRLGGSADALAWSADGRTIAAVRHLEHDVQFWDARTGRCLASMSLSKEVPGSAISVVISPDGKHTVVQPKEGQLELRDWRTGRAVCRFPGVLRWRNISFSPDGRRIVAVSDGVARVFDARNGKPPLKLRCPEHPRLVQFAPKGNWIVTGHLEGSYLWDAKTGKLIKRLSEEHVVDIVFSPAEPWVAVLDDLYGQRRLRLFDLPSGKARTKVDVVRSAGQIAVAPDGRIGVGGNNVVQFWSPKGTLLGSVRTGRHFDDALAFSPNGKLLVTNGPGDRLRFWEGTTAIKVAEEGHKGYVSAVRFSPDGKWLATGDFSDSLCLWSVKGWKLQHTLRPRGLEALAFSPDSKQLAEAGPYGVQVWDMKTAKAGQRLAVAELRGAECGSLAWTADGRKLIVGTDKGRLDISLPDGKTTRDRAQPGSLAFGPGIAAAMDWKATHLYENGLRVGSSRPGATLVVLDCPELACLSAAGKIVDCSRCGCFVSAAGRIGGVMVWDATAGPERFLFDAPRSMCEAVAFSPDSRFLVAGDRDGVVRVWELITGRPARVLCGHRGWISSLDFHPRGDIFASGSHDNMALVWPLLPPGRRAVFAEGGEQLPHLWADLGGKDPARAWQAVSDLVAAGDRGVAYLAARLKPATAPGLTRMVAGLGSDEVAVREDAMAGLRKLGWAARPTLLDVVAHSRSKEAVRRAKEILKATRSPLLGLTAQERRMDRAIAALERIGSPKAIQLLRALAGGAKGAWGTSQAARALERLRATVASRRP